MNYTELIHRCKQHDSEAQRQIYLQLSETMMGVCMRYCENRADAEDLLHDGFVHLFKKIDDFRGEGSFEGWARRIFVSIALSRIRRKKLYQKESPIDSLTEKIAINTANVIATMESNDILNYIQKLPPRYKTILNLFSIEGYSHQEISEKLGISVESSRVGLLRAKALLYRMLTQAGIL